MSIPHIAKQSVRNFIRAITPLARTAKSWADSKNESIVSEPVKLYNTATGDYYLPTNAPDDWVINAIKSGTIFDAEIVELAKHYAKPGSTLIDVGANFGQMSVLFSKMVGTTGSVHAFEADPFIFDLLNKNLQINSCSNVHSHFGAVHKTVDESVFYPEQDFKQFPCYGSYGIDPTATAGRKIPTLTIDSLSIDTPVSFMKVDIQGCDLFALQGALETIKRHQMPIIFEFEQDFQETFSTSFQDYVDFVDHINYRFDRTIMKVNYLVVPKEN